MLRQSLLKLNLVADERQGRTFLHFIDPMGLEVVVEGGIFFEK